MLLNHVDGMDVKVMENADDCVHITLPAAPAGHMDLSDDEPSNAAGGVPTPPLAATFVRRVQTANELQASTNDLVVEVERPFGPGHDGSADQWKSPCPSKSA
jgi:hypothetical protein